MTTRVDTAIGRAMASTSLNLFVLFLASFLVRRAWVNDGLFEHDSVKLAQAMEATYETGRLQPVAYFADKVGGRHGLVLVNLPLYVAYRAVTGRVSSEYILLASAALFGSLAVYMLYLIVARLADDRLVSAAEEGRSDYSPIADGTAAVHRLAAFGAGLMFSASPIFVSVSTGAKDHALSAFLAALAMSLLIGARSRVAVEPRLVAQASCLPQTRLLSSDAGRMPALPAQSGRLNRAAELSRNRGRLVAASVALGLAPLVRDTSVSLVLPYALAFVWLRSGEKRPLDVACAFAPAGVMIALAMWLQREWLAAMVGYHTFQGVWSAQTPLAIGALSRGFGLIGWALVACGLVELRRRWGWTAVAVMAAWFLPEFIYYANVDAYKPRLLTQTLLPLYVAAGAGLAMVGRRSRLAAVVLMAYVAVASFAAIKPVISFRHQLCGPKDYALFVKAKTERDAVILTMDDQPFIEYYAGRKTLLHPVLRGEPGDVQQAKRFIDEVRARVERGTPAYLMESGLSYDDRGLICDALRANFDLAVVGSKLTEDYHGACLQLRRYEQKLYRVSLR